jgi:putative hydrolase of the HAD superfamily
LQWLSQLKQQYRVTILSNTNDIHISYVHELLGQHGLKDFSSLVHQVYYSHEVNLRKPNTDIYQYVLDHADYLPSETLFLDDNAHNVAGAQAVGIQTIRVTDPTLIPNQLQHEGIQF